MLLLLLNFVITFRLEYQAKYHSSAWFSVACSAVIAHNFFSLLQQNKSSESKVKFRQTSNHCKWVLEVAKLAYPSKTKASITGHLANS